ncbi:Transposon Ty3-I Gag-Pol polyprotein [Gossypium australe]|uniref:Transposon Ty3-I Gag-Pol polyprotein n=1 Tax=Gossypium australe TaxID=47621 RepID=A0A5B6WGU1_9ROSI|nr:Transposon Ty3-I Gag-Pol polyprotein [Gossypium australe]
MGSTKALHITTRCKGYTLPGVLIDNGSKLNVLPLSTLNRLPVDSSHMKTCQNIMRAFDGTERKVMGRIEIPLLIGANIYKVDFLVMDIKPSYNYLLGRLWIHSIGAVLSSLHQKLKLVTEGRLIILNAEEDIIVSITSDAPYIEADGEAIECSFRLLEFVNATFIVEGSKIPMPKISKATRMGLQLIVEKGALPGKRLGKYLHGRVEVPILTDKRDSFSLGYKPDAKQRKKELEKKQKRRRARLSEAEVNWEPITFPHISKIFVLGGIIYLERKMTRKEIDEDMMGNPSINAISEKGMVEENLSGIRPYELGSVLNNWTVKEILVVFRANSEFQNTLVALSLEPIRILLSPDVNDMSDAATDPESPFERDMCLEGSQDFEDGRDLEIVNLGDGKEKKEVKIGACITVETKRDLIELLQEFKDVFKWSYQYMPGLSTDIVVHRLPIKEECKPVQQKLRRMRPDVLLKIKEEVKKQFDAGFLQVVKCSEWVANIVPIPKKYGKIKMHPEDMDKTTFVTIWGMFCSKVMPFGLKNTRATYQRAMVTLFHDMMHKEIEVYVDDMIAKSRTEGEHVQVLRKLFLRLRKFQLKLNPAKCVWDDECQKAFDKVKQYLSSPPVLSPPCPEYEACIMGIRATIERKIKVLEVYEDSTLVIYQLKATENDKRTLRRLASDYVLDDEILYKRRKDQVLSRCVDAIESKKILEEVHEGVCGTHANGFTMARQIMRFGYYWSTMEGDCINYAKKCNKCQIYGDKIHVPPSPLHVMTSPCPFSIWGMDVIGPIPSKASNGHHFIFVVIDYFTKWVEAASYANVTKLTVSKFLKKEIICRYGMLERIISDNALDLNNIMIAEREKLPFALYAYRTSVRTSTWATPFSLVYEMEAVLPIEVEIPSLRVLLKAIRHGQMYQKRMMRAYNKKVRPREFHEGDLVLKKILPIQKDVRGKWIPNWEGPYVVKKAFSRGALILTEMDVKTLPNSVNSDLVKKYFT